MYIVIYTGTFTWTLLHRYIYMVYTMNIIVYWICPRLICIYTLYIHGIYHEHHSILNVSLADHDAIVYEWSKSLNFQFTINVQRCPDDLEFLWSYAHRHSSTLHRREGVRILRSIEKPYTMYREAIYYVYGRYMVCICLVPKPVTVYA